MDPIMKYKEGKQVSIITLFINSILAICKTSIGYLAHSQALIADGIHSASDSFSTIIVLISLKVASNPPDTCHPYGHERSETLATNILALSLILSGVMIVKSNIICILNQDYHTPATINIWVALFSILAQEGAYRYSNFVGKKINSKAIIADAKHHRSDALSSVAALIGVIAARNGYPSLDPLAGIIVAFIIIKIGIQIFIPIINEIMEKAPTQEYLNSIRKITQNDGSIKKVSSIKVRKHAGSEIIEMTISVETSLHVDEAHYIAEQAKNRLMDNLKENIIDVIIHVHPINLKKDDSPLLDDS